MQEAILRMKRADWVRPLLELLEGQARHAGPNGLSTGQKALAAHLFDIMLTEVCHQATHHSPQSICHEAMLSLTPCTASPGLHVPACRMTHGVLMVKLSRQRVRQPRCAPTPLTSSAASMQACHCLHML